MDLFFFETRENVPPKTECGCLPGGVMELKRSHTQSCHRMDCNCTCMYGCGCPYWVTLRAFTRRTHVFVYQWHMFLYLSGILFLHLVAWLNGKGIIWFFSVYIMPNLELPLLCPREHVLCFFVKVRSRPISGSRPITVEKRCVCVKEYQYHWMCDIYHIASSKMKVIFTEKSFTVQFGTVVNGIITTYGHIFPHVRSRPPPPISPPTSCFSVLPGLPENIWALLEIPFDN